MIFNYSVLTRLLVTSRVIAILLPVQTKMFRTFLFCTWHLLQLHKPERNGWTIFLSKKNYGERKVYLYYMYQRSSEGTSNVAFVVLITSSSTA